MSFRPVSIFRNAIALGLIGFVASASATTVTVSATQDVMIFGTSAGADTGNASGMGPAMFAGADGGSNRKRSLVTFDLASAGIPSTATITSVVMTLYIGQIAGSGGGGGGGGSYPSRTIRLYHVNTAWNEGPSGSPTSPTVGGTGQGYSIMTGDTSWTYTNYSGSSWSSLGGDFNATPICSQTFNAPFSINQALTWSSAGMVTDVQNWLATPSSYLGWLIKSDLETSPTSFLGFWTKDGAAANSNPAIAPKLEITYTP